MTDRRGLRKERSCFPGLWIHTPWHVADKLWWGPVVWSCPRKAASVILNPGSKGWEPREPTVHVLESSSRRAGVLRSGQENKRIPENPKEGKEREGEITVFSPHVLFYLGTAPTCTPTPLSGCSPHIRRVDGSYSVYQLKQSQTQPELRFSSSLETPNPIRTTQSS